MNINNFILFRKNLRNFRRTPFGIEGLYVISNKSDIDLLSKFKPAEVREVYHQSNSNNADLQNLEIGNEIIIKINFSKFLTYYETFSEFIEANKLKLSNPEFYIFEFDYLHNTSNNLNQIENYLGLQNLISFLKELSAYHKESSDKLELFFHKPDSICPISVDYKFQDFQTLEIYESVEKTKEHIFETTDRETRIKLFTNEMMNILSNDEISFKSLLRNWDSICNSYNNSFQLYLSEFSFEKIKASSQEHFHELTDKIYSTINKFSSYILAIPVAYILIVRFFDFSGVSLAKDSFLIIIGILYFIIIWFVLLNNLHSAFNTIEEDIGKLLNRIKNEKYLADISETLDNQLKEVIPGQKIKINLVRIISLIILMMTFGAYLYIYHMRIITLLLKSGLIKLNIPPYVLG